MSRAIDTTPSEREVPIRLDREELGGFERMASLEWLETNGLGGWASSTVSGANTRRYHGLLVASAHPPLGRSVLLARLDEVLRVEGEPVELGTNRFPGAVHPRGFERLESFERGLFPVATYRIGEARLERTVAAIHGENTTVVVYRLTGTEKGCELEVWPFVAGRDYHALGRAHDPPPAASFGDGVLRIRPLDRGMELHLAIPGAGFEARPDWWYRFAYDRERERGLDHEEDLWTPGPLRLTLEPGVVVACVASSEWPGERDGLALVEAERARREGLLGRVPGRDEATARLILAADQFLVRRGEAGRTVIAGYPWFGDWGRDTLIALPGLTLCTGRPEEAGRVLRAFAAHLDRGMIPNRFPDDGAEPEYNTVDATPWFFVSLWRVVEATGDDDLAREMLPVLREAVRWHREGTRYGIVVDDDGLLMAGEAGVQLTWMDARVGDHVVTPRHGKAVEVNALWVNALHVLAALERRLGDGAAADELDREIARLRRQFSRLFWYDEGGYLYDVVDGEGRDDALRPNQILALALPFPLLSARRRRSVLKVVEENLLTPVGLRTLAPGHPEYRPRYEGGPVERDGAYHQGTVWPWLLGPYVTALVRERGERGRRQARELLEGALGHLSEAGLGTFSEIFDGDPPHAPRGAIAQAWSVAEVLRAWREVAG